MAAKDSPYTQVEPLERAVLAESLQGILGARGSEPAGWRGKRAYAQLVELYEHYRRENEDLFDSLF